MAPPNVGFYKLEIYACKVPKKHGVVSRRAVDDVDMIGPGHNSIMIDEENVKMVVRELEYDRHFIKK